ncbi:MAG: cytochrome b N-terminal domain-containing protein [Chloroflexi bacterium]|nr:cytochrome b N-terminal domain-containing protein [Chloroflexota bacterium]
MTDAEAEPSQTQQRPGRLYGWFQERLDIQTLWGSLFARKIPFGVNLLYTLGFICLALFIMQAVTGAVLAIYYVPTPDHAYDSVDFLITQVTFGQVIRGIHHWGADAMIVAVVLHMVITFAMGAYKFPRETTWWAGVLLLGLTFAFGFTGYLLPWDEKSYWATSVGTNMMGVVPVIGDFLERLARGGAQLGALTLTRFYAMHVLVLPMLLATITAMHLFLVIWLGVSVPPGIWDRAMRLGNIARSRLQWERVYHAVYEDFKAQGRRFFPDLIVEDALAGVSVILLVVVLAVLLGTPLESPADPTNTTYVPRPEWYFLFLFQLLRYFPGSVEWIGVALLPLLFFVFLVLAPFLDRGLRRSPRYRPISMGVLGLSLVAVVGLSAQAWQTTPPELVQDRTSRLNSTQLLGQELINAQDCRSCHVVAGTGANIGPDLDGIGRFENAAFIHSYIADPKSVNPSATMPPHVPPLTHEQVEDITQYLLTLPADAGGKG